jgi:hypothetical protein
MTDVIKEYSYQIKNQNTGTVRTKKVTRKYQKKARTPNQIREFEPNEVRKTYTYNGKEQIRIYKVKKTKKEIATDEGPPKKIN